MDLWKQEQKQKQIKMEKLVGSWFNDTSLSPAFFTHIFTCFDTITNDIDKWSFYHSSPVLKLLFYPYAMSNNLHLQSNISQGNNIYFEATINSFSVSSFSTFLSKCITLYPAFLSSPGYAWFQQINFA